MPSVVADTSVWIEHLRGTGHRALAPFDAALRRRELLLCPMIELELLRGVRPAEQPALAQVLSVVPVLDHAREDFQLAGERLNRLQTKGHRLPATDALIAAFCIRRGLELVTLDSDFQHFQGLRMAKL